MSDSFADLWNSTGASKPAEQPRKLGSLTPVNATPIQRQDDVFSMLASAGGSSPAPRSGTPSATGSIQLTRSLGANAMGSLTSAKPVQKSVSSGGDAFSGLFSAPLGSSSTNGARMTIAERAAQVERERTEQLLRQQTTMKQQSSAWAGLDSLGHAAPSQSSIRQADDWAFDFEPKKASSSASLKPPTPPQDDWGLDDFIAQPTATKISSTKPTQSLLDLDEFTSPTAAYSDPQAAQDLAGLRSNTPGDFDFGDREDRLLDNNSDDEDDILGELSKPVSNSRPSSTRPNRTAPSPQPNKSGSSSRTVSPPPHILGQIVEMGFSIQQARVALAATDTGLDVQAALETLLSNGAGAESPSREEPSRNRRNGQREPGSERYYESDEEQGEAARRRRQPPARRGAPPTRSREPTSRDASSPASDGQRNLQEHADKLIAQASEIGLNMFNRANAFWKENKEKAMRVYEERAAAQRQVESTSRSGCPKWMQDGHAPEGEWGQSDLRDDAEVISPQTKQAEARLPPQERQSQSSASRAKTGNLLPDDPPAVYTSPFRRKTPGRNQAPTPTQSAPATPPQPPRAPSPVQLVQRKTISASPTAIAASAKHKAAGTEMFKLGRYAEAETSYSAAIAALPESHLLLVPLYNNRALARIKTGDHSGAIEDCTIVIRIIGPSYHPAREARVTKDDEGAGVDLGDGLVKAWWRRAEAYEGKEKWDEARQDWEAIVAADFAGKARTEAIKGASRCRRMLTAYNDIGASSSTAPAAAKPTSKPKPRPVRPAVVVPTEALDRVREANQAAEAEDQQKAELKDVVDARLNAWRNGKENNIRALIASLDTVLWPGLGWQKVGMHELVTPAQVKIRYTKAIAKLHPDKLNARNTTVEQRMIANGVFGSLNDAWNAFKQ